MQILVIYAYFRSDIRVLELDAGLLCVEAQTVPAAGALHSLGHGLAVTDPPLLELGQRHHVPQLVLLAPIIHHKEGLFLLFLTTYDRCRLRYHIVFLLVFLPSKAYFL